MSSELSYECPGAQGGWWCCWLLSSLTDFSVWLCWSLKECCGFQRCCGLPLSHCCLAHALRGTQRKSSSRRKSFPSSCRWGQVGGVPGSVLMPSTASLRLCLATCVPWNQPWVSGGFRCLLWFTWCSPLSDARSLQAVWMEDEEFPHLLLFTQMNKTHPGISTAPSHKAWQYAEIFWNLLFFLVVKCCPCL